MKSRWITKNSRQSFVTHQWRGHTTPWERLRKWEWNLRRMGSGRKWVRRTSRPFPAQGDFWFHWPDYSQSAPIMEKVCHPLSLSHTHLTLIMGCVRKTRERSWWEVAARSLCVCETTFFYHPLTLSPEQPCHYGAFPAYRGQLSHHEISPRAQIHVILPLPPVTTATPFSAPTPPN